MSARACAVLKIGESRLILTDLDLDIEHTGSAQIYIYVPDVHATVAAAPDAGAAPLYSWRATCRCTGHPRVGTTTSHRSERQGLRSAGFEVVGDPKPMYFGDEMAMIRDVCGNLVFVRLPLNLHCALFNDFSWSHLRIECTGRTRHPKCVSMMADHIECR